MDACELVRKSIDLDRPLDQRALDHVGSCVGCAREWRSHTALTAHFEAAAIPAIPPAPAAMPLPAAAGSGERLPRRVSPALVRIYLAGFILASGWIVGTTLRELAGVVAIDRVALVTGVVGLTLFTMKPIRMMMRLLVQALRI